MYAENSGPRTLEMATTPHFAAVTPRGLPAASVGSRGTLLAVTAELTVMAFVIGAVTQTGGLYVAGVVLLVCTLLGTAITLDGGLLHAETGRAPEEHDEAAVRVTDAHAAMRGAVFSTVHPSMQAAGTR